ncbi:MAG: hypothetical protein ACUVT9_05945 [Candidatus Bathycorpusculaceae bacterium]
MSEEKAEEGVIKNTGVLDLSSAVEEEIERIKKIKNAGVVIVPEKFIGRVSVKMENVGVVIPYREGMKLYSGESRLNADTLKSVEEPISIINAGKLFVEKNVTAELIIQKIREIRNYGKIIAPKLNYGALMSKISQNAGKIEILEEYVQKRVEELQKEIEKLRKMGED